MARIRSIKPEFFTSEKVASLPLAARLTFIGMWTEADDYGNLVDNPRLLKGHLWPLDDDVTPVDLSLHVQTLVDAGLVDRYQDPDGKRFLHVRNWEEHQKMNRRAARKHPASPWETDAVRTQCVDTAEPVEVPRRTPKDTETASSAYAHKSCSVSGSGVGGGKGSGGGGEERRPDLRAVLNGQSTTTTFDPRIEKQISLVAVALARQYARPGEEAAYRASIRRKPDDHAPELARLTAEHPELDDDEIVDRYLESRRKQPPPKARCGICGGEPHPEGAAGCPKLNGAA